MCALHISPEAHADEPAPRLVAQDEIGGRAWPLDRLPPGLTLDRELGVVVAASIGMVQAVGPYCPYGTIFGPRAVKAPNGDYLVFGAHDGLYFSPEVPANHAVMWRSTDQGMTWAEGVRPWQMQGSKEHCIVPFIDPSEPNRIYTMGNASLDSKFTADVVLRYSDDNGHTWTERGRWSKSDVPQKIAGFRGGPVHMRGAVLGDGTWLWGVYDRDGTGLKGDRQFVLRSEDQGMSWTLHPIEGQNGWYHPDWDKFMEGSVVATGGRNATLYLRAPGGRMYEKRTTDSGLTWSETKETPGILHPDAPPMVFPFAGGKWLIALIHNRYTAEHPHHYHPDRNALWFAVSDDAGLSWCEPRFLIAQAKVPGNSHPQIGIHPLEGSLDWNVSYADLLAHGQNLHLCIGDGQRRALHLRFSENDLGRFPTKEELHHRPAWSREPFATESVVWSKDEDDLWPYHVPGILVTRRGTVLVWADARQDGGSDFAPHHMVLKRSVDQGRTWSVNQYLGRIDQQEIYLFGNAVQPRDSDRIYFFYTQKHPADIHRRTWIWLRHSDDDGVSWSEPREMVRILVEQDRERAEAIRQGTAGQEFQGEDPERYAREQFYTGPGRIIQLAKDHPVAPGRIIVPVLAVKDRDSQERSDLPSLLRRGQGNAVLYSDDQGQTWIAGGAVPMSGLPLGEPSIVELSDGRLLMNARVEKHDYRVTSLSTDGGLSWSKPTRDTSGIPTYFETHSGLLRMPPDSPSGSPAPILFSFPNAPTRRNMTVMVSLDDHQSWVHRRIIHTGRSYYSNMEAHDGFIYLIYGRGGEHPWFPAETVLLRFNYEWLKQTNHENS